MEPPPPEPEPEPAPEKAPPAPAKPPGRWREWLKIAAEVTTILVAVGTLGMWCSIPDTSRLATENPTSTAFGVGQLTIANRWALMGGNANSTDCGAQIQAFQKYTLGRYGSFDRALQFHKRNGWY